MNTLKLKISIFLIFTFNITLSQQLLDATLLEVNFSGDSYPRNLTKTANKIYFSADDGYRGRELWVYDGITNETRIVKDIRSGNISSISNSNFITIDDNLFFTSNDGLNGEELWISDGSEEGTFLLKDINSGSESSTIVNFYIHNNILYFSANDAINGQELWRSDGTTSGTYLLKDINTGIANSSPNNFFTYNNLVFFSANTDSNGTEIWVTDGTSSGTILLKDINPGSQSSSAFNFFEFNNYLYFVAYNPTTGYELWKSDGTETGTNLLIDINTGLGFGFNFNDNFLIFENNFYFFANNGINGYELWKSDGTSNGTFLLKDINVGPNSSASYFVGIATNSFFLFSALTNTTGTELWISDGTAEGTSLLKDINLGFQSSLFEPEFTYFNNEVYFKANNNINGEELWKTNGTVSGTEIVKDIFPGQNTSNIKYLTKFNNVLLFSARDYNNNKLWKTNGTNTGTIELKDIDLNDISNSELKFLEFNGNVYFAGGYGSLNGNELWETDGTVENTKIVYDIYKKWGVSTSGESDFTKFNNKIIFAGTNGLSGVEPFISDGTIAGTKIIKDIVPGSSGSIWNSQDNRPFFTQAGNYVFFRATNGAGSGFEIFRTDGTEEGTFMVKDIAPGNTSSINDFPTFFGHNGIFYFKANDQVHGEELWRSDGTTEGTFMLKDILPGNLGGIYFSNFYENHYNAINRKCFAPIGQYLYFMAKDEQGNGLWRTDGSTTGTTKILAITSSGSFDSPIIIGSNGNKIFYITNINNSSYGNNSLWVTDGTQSGTFLLGQYLITGPQQFKKSTNLGDFFYYTIHNNNGSNLMKTDGTLAGTSQVTNFNYPVFDRFNFLEKCGNYIYFLVDSYGSPFGRELWRTNGTLNNTILVEGFEFGNPNFIANCTCINDHLFYTKDYFPNSVFYISNDNIIPTQLQMNIVNAPNFGQNEGINTQGLLNLNNNILFVGGTHASGGELYFSELGNLLSIISQNPITISNDIIIYPNPSKGIFYIKPNIETKIENIQIVDLNGKIVDYKFFDNEYMDCSNLSKGIYILKIITKEKTYNKKIIIE
jgi:ELWxxDGT repeat protein